MDINSLLKGVDCACGKKHNCDIKFVYIENNATQKLKEILAPFNKIHLVADQNTFKAAGERVERVLGDKIVFKTIFDGDKILIPDEKAIERVESALSDADFILGIGSGVIQDLCKYVAFDKKLNYAIVATAPSMDGYASSGAAMITDGMKVTYSAGMPYAIVADVDVLVNAPMDMIKSGYGDVIGKYSSLNDWKLASAVNGEYFCDYIYGVTFDMVLKTQSLANGLINRDEQSVKVLMEALVIVGIMMSFAGSSRPASGSEHHLSHFFEITGIVSGEDYLPHGTDVAYSTIITAMVRENLLKMQLPCEQYKENQNEKDQNLDRLYRSVAGGCKALQEKLCTYNRDRLSVYRQKENEIRAILKEMPSASEIESILAKVGFDKNEFYAFYGKQKILDAVKYAKDLKDRYTVLWYNYDVNEGKL